MAFFDPTSSHLVVRVVYDGLANAGKTTNLRMLCNAFTTMRRGELMTPAEADGRTLLFDFLRLDGGLVAGHPLRCHLYSVPGQGRLLQRRLALLRSADVVVLVCDSTPDGLVKARRRLGNITEVFSSLIGAPVPIVVQANKQDLPEAREPQAVLAELGLPAGTPVSPARALEGIGVRETLVLGIRAAATALQERIVSQGIDSLPVFGQTPEALRAELEQLDREAEVSITLGLHPSEPPPEVETKPELPKPQVLEPDVPKPQVLEPDVPKPQVSEPELRKAPEPQTTQEVLAKGALMPSPVPEREAVTEPAKARPRFPEPPLPHADLPTGFIWPGTRGRELLRLDLTQAKRRDDLVGQLGTADGSGRHDAHVYQFDNWCLKTSERRCFTDGDQGRAVLARTARAKVSLGDWMLPDTVLVLVPHGGKYWLWTIAPWCVTLRHALNEAARHNNETELARLLGVFAKVAFAAAQLARDRDVGLDVHPSNFGFGARGICYIDDDIDQSRVVGTLAHALVQRFAEYAESSAACEAYLGSIKREIAALSPQTLAAIGLEAQLSTLNAAQPAAERARLGLLQVLENGQAQTCVSA